MDYEGKKSTPLTQDAFDLVVVAVKHKHLDLNLLKKSSQIIFDCTGSIDGSYVL